METMMLTFHRFAGDKDYLTKEDLRVLMEREFPGFLEVSVESLRTRPKSQSALPLSSHPSPVGPLLGNVSFVYLVDSVRIAQGQQRGKRLRPCPQSAGGNIHTHWNNMRTRVFPQAVMGQRMLLLRAIALMTDAPHSRHLPLETT